MKLLIGLTLLSITSGELLHDSSDEFIDYINNAQSSWIAGKNFEDDIPVSFITNKLGAKSEVPSDLERHDHVIDEEGKEIPESFDARDQWPKCKDIIAHVSDQSSCQSDWAVATASAMSDRLCIRSEGTVTVQVSAGNILSCCARCGFQCGGGWVIEAWNYWQQFGVVTGGDFNTTQGCQAYPFPPCEHYGSDNTTACSDDSWNNSAPVCINNCTADTKLDYEKDLTFGNDSYWVYPNVTQLQLEIMTNGPVVGQFLVYDDFVNYKQGVYVRVSNNSYGTHAVKILGWGTDDNVDYWLVSNTWNPGWGDNGFFKILRGEDHCGIEGEAIAGTPNVTAHSPGSSNKFSANFYFQFTVITLLILISM